MAWLNRTWDIDSFYYSISSDERDEISGYGAFAQFGQAASFIFFVYALVQACLLAASIPVARPTVSKVWDALASATTPLQFGITVPTGVVVIVSAAFSLLMIDVYVSFMNALFAPKGAYDRMAALLKGRERLLRHNLTGQLLDRRRPVANATVKVSISGQEYPSTTDDHGFYFLNIRNLERQPWPIAVTYRFDFAGDTIVGQDEIPSTPVPIFRTVDMNCYRADSKRPPWREYLCHPVSGIWQSMKSGFRK